jgi:eukaryotic-like serine/threonine-protein kinase
MALGAGSRLGHFEIEALLGVGGMGEIYRARDARLDRIVALKVLAPALADDPAFRVRFEREAKAISGLTHPHICRLYDIGREDQREYLVLELLEGETLAARLERGRLPLREVLAFGVDIADALEAAHRQGIVHRDLKPANVMVTPGGTKLLDFGLAKTTGGAAQQLSQLATAPGTATAQGTIIGTLQYMAPEQVQGQPADVRTDIFALGALLYEMATGRHAFEAPTQASLIAKILETEPPTVSSLAPLTPPALDHIVQGCLMKMPADRWQTAHDVKMQLQWIQAQGSRLEAPAPVTASRSRMAWVPWVVAATSAALAATLLVMWPRPVVTQAPPARFDLIVPPRFRLNEWDVGAISPDGRRFVFTAQVDGPLRHLVLRDLNSTEMVVMPDTADPWRPFWSPDSQSVAFIAGNTGHLRMVHVAGGPARTLAETKLIVGGTWAPGVILFGPPDRSVAGHIYRVADTGGPASALETLPWKPGERPFVSPRFLPDGRHFVVNVAGDPALYLASIDAPGTRKILDDASSAAYGAGYLFYARGAGLFARPFDAERLEISGAEIQVSPQAAGFSVSDHGTIAYRHEIISPSRLTWFDRSGRRTGTLGESGPYLQMVLSPSGRRAAVVRLDQLQGDLWDVDLKSGMFSRLTSDPADDSDPSWSPDERALAFTSTRTGVKTIFKKDLVTDKEERLVPFDQPAVLDQWTPDGRFVIFRTHGKAVYAMPLGGDGTVRTLTDTPYSGEDEVHVSPDGRWVAFESDASGRFEVYVAAFPAFTSKRLISSGGGVQPQWRADSREVFYLAPDGSMMSVRVDARTELRPSPPVRLFSTNILSDSGLSRYAVTGDGQRFLGLEPVGGVPSFSVILNWPNARPR